MPKDAAAAYREAEGWKDFSIIEVIDDELGIKSNNSLKKSFNNTVYLLNGIKQSNRNKGIMIVNGRKII